MYLLMLLATFISAMYGYNLSARPDYDRDVVRKKAAAVVYKFVFHHKAVKELVFRVGENQYESCGLVWFLHGDTIFANFSDSNAHNNEENTIFYKQDGSVKHFYLRAHNKNGETQNVNGACGTPFDHLLAGHFLYDGDEMTSQILCLDKDMWETGAGECDMSPYESADPATGSVTERHGSCCTNSKYRYLISYKKIDARWVNRITQGINLDFWNVLSKRPYTDNIGIIHWDGHNWQFQGRINFYPVYAEDKIQWEEVDHKNDPIETKYYPAAYRERTVWTLPNNVFGQNIFKGKSGNNICQSGCLFKIQYF